MANVQMTDARTPERVGTRAVARYVRVSPFKARQVLDLIRGKQVDEADEILQLCPRDAAIVVRKCLNSAVANASHNGGHDAAALQVAACYADEGPTLKRWRPRARLRHGRIRKRTSHITVVVAPMADADLERWQRRRARGEARVTSTRRSRDSAAVRRARVARSRAEEARRAESPEEPVAEPAQEAPEPSTDAPSEEAKVDAHDKADEATANGEEDE